MSSTTLKNQHNEQNSQMSFKGTFSFRNDNIRLTQIDDGIFLRIEKIGPAIARVYFVDDTSVETAIPDS
jgi:hypothetical protein